MILTSIRAAQITMAAAFTPSLHFVPRGPLRFAHRLLPCSNVRKKSYQVRAVATGPASQSAQAPNSVAQPRLNDDVSRPRPHEPVMTEEILAHFREQPMKAFLDCTLGAGGHASSLLGSCNIERYIGVDKDANALEIARKTLHENTNVDYVRSDFQYIDSVCEGVLFDGALMDLGVSSMQLDTASRGFSFSKDGPLDMRMDSRTAVTAADLVARLREDELRDLFRTLADDSYAAPNARRIVEAREQAPILTTTQLANAISPPGSPRGRTHPATLPFQALRIAVNEEVHALRECLPVIMSRMAPGGKLAVISFHSLEDRIVKNAFRDAEVVGGVDVLTRKPLIPSDEEVRRNVRSRSAKLRVVRKLADGQTPKRFKRNKYRD